MNTNTYYFSPYEKWTLSFSAVIPENKEKELLLKAKENGKTTIEFYINNCLLTVKLKTYEKDAPLLLSAALDKQYNDIRLIWYGYRVELWINETLLDEEWPIGSCFHSSEATAEAFTNNVTNFSYSNNVLPETEDSFPLKNAQYWAPKQNVINAGDCMPFFDGKLFHVYYLKDRKGHQSKWGLGAHQFAHISSADLQEWTIHPNAVSITHQWEGSICTGSIIKANELYYAFYAVRMSDGTSAKVSWATSGDSIHFTKSENYFNLHFPYESTSVRDPEVFLGEDGQYHMLLTTSWQNTDPEERNGCLAHLVSKDLENWQELSPFSIPGYTDQPECCNYFYWNGWYYLIFSNYGTAKYRYSEKPFGPWKKPKNEIIGSCLYRVPKTAAFHDNRRIAVGFLTKAIDGHSYAGNLIFRELIQHPNGTLGSKFIPEMISIGTEKQYIQVMNDSISSYQQESYKSFSGTFNFSSIISAEHELTTYGFTLEFDSGVSYEIRSEPFNQKLIVCPLHSNPLIEDSNFTLYNMEGLDKTGNIHIVFNHGILDICVNESRTLICRLKDSEKAQKCKVGCFAKDGNAFFDIIY